MPVRFRARWIPLAATLIVMVIGLCLGQWQTRRGNEKQALQARMIERQAAPAIPLEGNIAQLDLRQSEYRHMRVQGEFVSGWTTYLDNRPYRGMPGLYVLTPFKIAGSDSVVLVERGWIQRDMQDRTKLPRLQTPLGKIEIEGVMRLHVGHLLQLGMATTPQPGAIMQNLDLPAYAEASGMSLAPFVIEQQSDRRNAQDGLVRDWPLPALGLERHRGYAIQWYALALMAVIFFIATGVRSGKK